MVGGSKFSERVGRRGSCAVIRFRTKGLTVAGPVDVALKLLGLGTPFIYAAGTYGFFHYLDKQASPKAKKAIAGWLKPREYERAAVSAALVEIFDRLYTRPLLGSRAALRSAVLTSVITLVFLYEIAPTWLIWPSCPDVDALGRAGTSCPDEFTSARLLAISNTAGLLITNIVSDYVSLFVVRRFLVLGGDRPAAAILISPILGALIVGIFAYLRVTVSFIVVGFLFQLGDDLPLLKNIGMGLYLAIYSLFNPPALNGAPNYQELLLSLSAFAVHLWLPLFGFGLLCVRGLNYLFWAIGKMQWFLKRGAEHPLDAVGYVLGAIVLVGAVAARLVS